MNIIRSLYGLKDASLDEVSYDLVVPLEYGVLADTSGSLPNATIECLHKAIEVVATGKSKKIAWGLTSYFGPGIKAIHNKKLECLKGKGLSDVSIYSVVSNNSIQEAAGINKIFPSAKTILIICDWRHGRRSRLIWKHFFPEAKIHFISIDSRWNEKHQSMWQCSSTWWLFANILHHLLMRLCGVPRLLNLVHRLTRKSS